MIDKTIKHIKKYFKTLKEILTAKISEKKNTLQGCYRGYLKQTQQYKKVFFLFFLFIKELDIKHGLNIN